MKPKTLTHPDHNKTPDLSDRLEVTQKAPHHLCFAKDLTLLVRDFVDVLEASELDTKHDISYEKCLSTLESLIFDFVDECYEVQFNVTYGYIAQVFCLYNETVLLRRLRRRASPVDEYYMENLYEDLPSMYPTVKELRDTVYGEKANEFIRTWFGYWKNAGVELESCLDDYLL